MPTGYTRQSAASIVNGLVVDAAPVNAELNQLQSAFSASTGHNHDGTTGGGAPINMTLAPMTGTKLGLTYGGTNADLSAATANANIQMNSGGTAFTYVKNNYAGTAAPAVTDDSGSGYQIGSLWFYSATLYFCT